MGRQPALMVPGDAPALDLHRRLQRDATLALRAQGETRIRPRFARPSRHGLPGAPGHLGEDRIERPCLRDQYVAQLRHGIVPVVIEERRQPGIRAAAGRREQGWVKGAGRLQGESAFMMEGVHPAIIDRTNQEHLDGRLRCPLLDILAPQGR